MGWWSVGLAAAFMVLIAAFLAAAASGQQGGETFADNLWLSVPALSAAACAALALLTGLLGVIARKERSVLVFLAIVIGAMVTVFSTGEILFPH